MIFDKSGSFKRQKIFKNHCYLFDLFFILKIILVKTDLQNYGDLCINFGVKTILIVLFRIAFVTLDLVQIWICNIHILRFIFNCNSI